MIYADITATVPESAMYDNSTISTTEPIDNDTVSNTSLTSLSSRFQVSCVCSINCCRLTYINVTGPASKASG